MTNEKIVEKPESEKKGEKSDLLCIASLIGSARKMTEKSKKIFPPVKNKTDVYVYQEDRYRRPRFYMVTIIQSNGKKTRKKKYLGQVLPKGMKLGKQ